MKALEGMNELEFRSLLLVTLHHLADEAQRSSVTGAVMDIEEFLDEHQDNGNLKLLEAFQENAQDEALRNYYATR